VKNYLLKNDFLLWQGLSEVDANARLLLSDEEREEIVFCVLIIIFLI